MRPRFMMAGVVTLALFVAMPALAAKPGNAPNAKSCQKGGWQSLYTRAGQPFTSEASCTSYGAQGGQIINQAAIACLNDGWRSLGRNATTTFTTEQECVDFVVNGGTPAAVHTFLGGRAWQDLNRNGLQDTGEAGLAGVTFSLRNSATDSLIAVAVSNQDGTYRFTDVPTGSYYIAIEPPPGWAPSLLDVGADDTIDNDFDFDSYETSIFVYSSGSNNVTIDAGLMTIGQT